jgi:hypothetical protein
MIDQNILEMFYSANQQKQLVGSGLIAEWNGVFFLNILDAKNWKKVYEAAKSLYGRDSQNLVGQESAFAKHVWFEDYLFTSVNVKRGARRYIPKPKLLDQASNVVGQVPATKYSAPPTATTPTVSGISFHDEPRGT